MEKCASVQRLVESQPDKLELTMENDGLVRVTGLDDRFTTNEVSQMLSTRFKLANTEKVLQSLEAAKFASITNPTENVPITKTANTAVIVDMYEVDYTPATLGESTQAIEKSFDAPAVGSGSSVVNTTSTYEVGAALFDLKNPRKLIAKSNEPIISPKKKYEQKGFVNNVIFPTGLVQDQNDKYLLLFSGGADTVTSVKKIAIRDILNRLEKV